MDQLFVVLWEFLAPALPYLLRLGEKGAEEAAKETGKAGAKKVWKALWAKLRPKVEAKEAAKEAAEDLAADPDDQLAQEIFRRQLKKLLVADEQLAREVQTTLEKAGVMVVQQQSGGGAQAQGSHQAVAGEGGVAAYGGIHNSSIFTGNVVVSHSTGTHRGTEALRTSYLHHLFAQLRSVPLSGIDPELANDSKAQMDLGAVYTALLTTDNEILSAGPGDMRTSPISALQQLDRNDRLVILGDPGSGKSTFVSFVAFCMIGELLGDERINLKRLTSPLGVELGGSRDEDEREPQLWRHGALLPVRVVLRDFAANGLPKRKDGKAGARSLLDFIRAELGRSSLGGFAEELEAELRSDGGLLLLDGLDEVPEAENSRVQLRNVVQDLAGAFPKCRIVVTSRVYAYQSQAWHLGDSFKEATLAPFSSGRIVLFIVRWYAEVARRRGLTSDDARGKASLLQRAIFANENLRALAERPLLLTLMASLHAWRGGILPEKRESLYAAAVDLLLAHWERQRVVQGPDGEAVVVQRSLTEWLKVSPDRLRSALDELAFEAHAGQTTPEGTADISEGELLAALARVSAAVEANPTLLVEYLRDRAGLILPRGVGVYTFPHRTFQEYLAARHLTIDEFPQKLVGLVRQDPHRWRETLLLAGAKAARGTPSSVWLLARELAHCNPTDKAAGPADQWGALLSGELLAESADLERISTAQKLQLDELRTHFVSMMRSEALESSERIHAGRALAKLGDPRAEVMTLDGMEFCYVSAGPFRPEDNEDGHAVPCDYWMGRFPVTVAQFRQYAYESGEIELESFQGDANVPVRSATPCQAKLFCGWLTFRWLDRGWLPEGWSVVLPSEGEWKKAVNGGLVVPRVPLVRPVRESEWWKVGDVEVVPNVGARGKFLSTVGRVALPVGCYSHRMSPYGCEDMGSVRSEWLRNDRVDWRDEDLVVASNAEQFEAQFFEALIVTRRVHLRLTLMVS